MNAAASGLAALTRSTRVELSTCRPEGLLAVTTKPTRGQLGLLNATADAGCSEKLLLSSAVMVVLSAGCMPVTCTWLRARPKVVARLVRTSSVKVDRVCHLASCR